jgi:hypothetical protein
MACWHVTAASLLKQASLWANDLSTPDLVARIEIHGTLGVAFEAGVEEA